ncbi:MAG: amidase family protein [Elainellaceae cyanobacterium]
MVGHKPSAGLIFRQGIQPLSLSLEQVGVVARCVDDAALIASVLSFSAD